MALHAVALLLALAALPALAASGYLCALALLSVRPPASGPPRRFPRLLCVVPAHDEAQAIARTVRSLLSTRYPAIRRRVWVVADNCTDDTADRATEAGAAVIVRNEPDRRGKGYALQKAFDLALEQAWAEAVVVVDADTEVNEGLLEAFAAKLEAGAQAVQAGSGVLNPEDSWRTRLMALALALFNGVRSLGRERLKVSCGLRGNGMCLSTDLLRRHPYAAFSVVEDLEYGIALGRAGIRVHYAPEAKVCSAMVSSSRAAASQRLRWERGRASLAKQWRTQLLLEALDEGDPIQLDLALDLFVPPLSHLAAWTAAGGVASAVAFLAGAPLFPAVIWAGCAAMLSVYIGRGVWVSGVGLGVLLSGPRYVAWKLSLRQSTAPREWVRTEREPAASTSIHPS